MRLGPLVALVVGALALAAPGRAADLILRDDPVCPLTLRGPIIEGDAARLAAALRRNRPADLCLDSPGGNLHEGLLMMDLLRQPEAAVRTHVRPGAICASACSYIFLAGSDRHAGAPVPARYIWPGGQLGVHAPRPVLPDATYTAAEVRSSYERAIRISRVLGTISDEWVGNRVTGRPLVTPWLHRRMLATPAERMFWVETVADAALAGVSLAGYRAPDPRQPANWARLCAAGFLLAHPVGQDLAIRNDAEPAADVAGYVLRTYLAAEGGPDRLVALSQGAAGPEARVAILPGSVRNGVGCAAGLPAGLAGLTGGAGPARLAALSARFYDYALMDRADLARPPSHPPWTGTERRTWIEPWFMFPPATRLSDLR